MISITPKYKELEIKLKTARMQESAQDTSDTISP